MRPALTGLRDVIPNFEKYASNGHAFFFQTGDTVYTGFADCLLRFVAGVTPVRPTVIHRFKGEPLNCAFRDSRGALWCGSSGAIFYESGSGWKRIALLQNGYVKTISEDKAEEAVRALESGKRYLQDVY